MPKNVHLPGYYRNRYLRLRRQGLCTHCGLDNDGPGILCLICRKKSNDLARLRRAAKKPKFLDSLDRREYLLGIYWLSTAMLRWKHLNSVMNLIAIDVFGNNVNDGNRKLHTLPAYCRG